MSQLELDTEARLGFAHAGLAVVRGLTITGNTMSYEDFGKAIGLIRRGDKWHQGRERQITIVLNLIAAVARQCREIRIVDFKMVVNKRTGRAGRGVNSITSIVTKPARNRR
jgi:hypothetical protein